MSEKLTERQAIERIWGFMRMGQEPRPAEVVLVLGSYDTRIAERGAEIFKQGLAARVTISGGGHVGGLTGHWEKSEAETFADVMEAHDVPRDTMWLDTRAENTGENAKFTGELWAHHGFDPKSVIAVTKPYMERRAYATLKKWWPQREVMMASPEVDFDAWVAKAGVSAKTVIDAMVGDLWRLREYPKQGFQIEMEIPDEVWTAYEWLTQRGYGRPERSGPKTRP